MPSGFRVCGGHLVGLKVGRGIDVGVVSAIAHRASDFDLPMPVDQRWYMAPRIDAIKPP